MRFLMRFGHMGGVGGMLVNPVATPMRCDSFSLEENLDNLLRKPDVHPLASQRIWGGVEMLFHLHVVVQVDLGPLPVGHFIGNLRQGTQRGFIQ